MLGFLFFTTIVGTNLNSRNYEGKKNNFLSIYRNTIRYNAVFHLQLFIQ